MYHKYKFTIHIHIYIYIYLLFADGIFRLLHIDIRRSGSGWSGAIGLIIHLSTGQTTRGLAICDIHDLACWVSFDHFYHQIGIRAYSILTLIDRPYMTNGYL